MDRIPQRVEASARTQGPNEMPIPLVRDVLPEKIVDSRAVELDELSLATLIDFFKLLDQWDREGKSVC
jgi:hypothetical protein